MTIVKRNPQHALGTVLPVALRLMTIATHGSAMRWNTQATVFRAGKTHLLTWAHEQIHPKFHPEQLVQPLTLSDSYAIVPASQVLAKVSLLPTIPTQWGANAAHLKRVDQLWAQWPEMLRAWFNALFWHEPDRLKGFLTAPASLCHHHARPGGLLEHSLDCVQRVLAQAQGDAVVNRHVLTFVALLHDVGKALEYVTTPDRHPGKLSVRGQLIGHKLSSLEWMATARLQCGIHIPEALAISVYHAIILPDVLGASLLDCDLPHYLVDTEQAQAQARAVTMGQIRLGAFPA